MSMAFEGSWKSVTSNIPGYVAGSEWLEFCARGDHVWKVAQRSGVGAPVITRFSLEQEGTSFRMRPFTRLTGELGTGWAIHLQRISTTELVVTPEHGFTTVFKREE